MKKINMSNVEESKGFESPAPGAYICRICEVADVPDKEYLKVSYDIAEGNLAGYYSEGRKEHPDWAWFGCYVKSYKTKALPMLKRFCSAVSKSNGNFVFDAGTINSDETTLVGKRIGLVFGEEEYYSNSGELKTRLYVAREFPVDQIASQKTPKLREAEKKPSGGFQKHNEDFMNVPAASEEGVPF